ncbi:MAG: DUF1850 domain-containing protein [Desulfobacteraceae bacterium]|nr:DUF1850 domain-containing protein [Desulfobacteraceae bacterium]
MKSLVAGVLALVLAACIPTGSIHKNDLTTPCLVVSTFPGLGELGRYPLGSANGFSLSFIHSVSVTPVIDRYEVVENNIVQTSETFMAHGAGLPSSVDEPGGVSWTQENNEFCLHMDRPIEKLVVRTDRNYKNRLLIGDLTVNLNQWEDQALLISVSTCRPR